MNPYQRRLERLETLQSQRLQGFVTVVELPQHIISTESAGRLVVATGVPQAQPRSRPETVNHS